MIIQTLLDFYKDCVLCPRKCHVDRIKGELGFCRLPAKIIMDCALVHHGEEPPLSGKNGAGTIFLSSCNLGCIYCQNYQISHSSEGKELSSRQLAEVMLDLQNRQCHNVEPVTPTSQTPLIMEALLMARAQGLNIPFVYNCGGYEDPEIIKSLDGMVEIYLPDFKYGLEEDAVMFSSAPEYTRFALDSIKEMVRQVGDELELKSGVAQKGVIIRHLVLPGRIENSKEVLRLIRKEISRNVYLSLMSQYTPTAKVRNHPNLKRRITKSEYKQLTDYALDLGFNNLFVQEVNDYELTPDFDSENPFDK
ncbi:MAG: radical SAM protein [Syntrophaceae bacterium]|nr:radical SAM protein [Syntrophaceae bacterium]